MPQSGASRSFHRNVIMMFFSFPPFTMVRATFTCLQNTLHLALHMTALAQINYMHCLLLVGYWFFFLLLNPKAPRAALTTEGMGFMALVPLVPPCACCFRASTSCHALPALLLCAALHLQPKAAHLPQNNCVCCCLLVSYTFMCLYKTIAISLNQQLTNSCVFLRVAAPSRANPAQSSRAHPAEPGSTWALSWA